MKGLLDTTVLIAREQGRPLGALPEESAISVVTLAELHIGVLLADEPRVRAQRMRSLSEVERSFDALPVDKDVARNFATIVADARKRGRKPKIMDAWIAATAVTHDLPVYTQDIDFDQLADVRVVRV
ncbi:MAG: PIN domain-containing protein [Actinobacteria bacterium]|nr:PIN domain-containing protein [Actinomycetota bacterium]